MSTPSPSTESAETHESGTGPIDEKEDMGFAWAMIRGSAIGIVFFIVVIFAMVWFLNARSDGTWDPAAIGVIALWTGIWAGLFLGGTVSVGLWAHKRHS